MSELRLIVEMIKIKWWEYIESLKEWKDDAMKNAPFFVWVVARVIAIEFWYFQRSDVEEAVNGSFIPLWTIIRSYIRDRIWLLTNTYLPFDPVDYIET